MDAMRIRLNDILLALTNAVDLVSPELVNHHKQVACLAFRLACQMELSSRQAEAAYIAGMLHDIGAITVDERLSLIESEPPTVNSHAFRGAKLLDAFEPFADAARAIRYHHVPWGDGQGQLYEGTEVPLLSHVLHAADRTCVMLRGKDDVLSQIPGILGRIDARSGSDFHPEAARALMELKAREHVWLELSHESPIEAVPELATLADRRLDIDELIQVARIYGRIIDSRSRFTATHSAGVTAVAAELASLAGFSPRECKMMMVAGYLHDLGKLTIPNAILDKPSQLDAKEYDIIRSHTFYTYHLLSPIQGFETINRWAALHHEKLNGKGYPFHLRDESIPLGSRIMAVADVFTALTEQRPYRRGMDAEQVLRILKGMVEDGSMCRQAVALALENIQTLTAVCRASQESAMEDYRTFFDAR